MKAQKNGVGGACSGLVHGVCVTGSWSSRPQRAVGKAEKGGHGAKLRSLDFTIEAKGF